MNYRISNINLKDPSRFYVSQLFFKGLIDYFFPKIASKYYFLPPFHWCGIVSTLMVGKYLGFYKCWSDFISLPFLYYKAVRFGVYPNISKGGYYAYHKPLAEFISKEFGVTSYNLENISVDIDSENSLQKILKIPTLFIASVNPIIRNGDDQIPEKKGGHLILIYGYDEKTDTFFYNDGAGYKSKNTQIGVEIGAKRLKEVFSGRGVIVEI